jgi:uncharacterized protein (DUF2147 family)
MRRVMRGIAALALPVSAATAGAVATAGTAGASAPVSCTKVVGNASNTVTLKGCGGGLGKGSAPALSLATGGTITWKGKNKGTTTIGNVSVTSPGQGGCKTGSTEEDFTGTVTANTSKANILGTTVSGRACVNGAGGITLVKHTTLVL